MSASEWFRISRIPAGFVTKAALSVSAV